MLPFHLFSISHNCFPVLIDIDGSIKEGYHVGNLPVSFLVDAGGVIEKVRDGGIHFNHAG